MIIVSDRIDSVAVCVSRSLLGATFSWIDLHVASVSQAAPASGSVLAAVLLSATI